jgi:hypothetical protein
MFALAGMTNKLTVRGRQTEIPMQMRATETKNDEST